jgi:sulfoxide reductase heme-binding subunit YedZ
VIFSLHAFVTRLSYAMLALHLGSLALDAAMPFGPRPRAGALAWGWREPWTGLGVLAAWLVILLGVSGGLRRLIGTRAWRAVHWLTFPLYGMALLHGIGAGSDSGTIWGQVLYLATGSVVLCLTLYRLLRVGARGRPPAAYRHPPRDRLMGEPVREEGQGGRCGS